MKCKMCFNNCRRFSPELKQSGWHPDSGKDLICPHCDTYHSSKTQDVYDKKYSYKDKITEYHNYWTEVR